VRADGRIIVRTDNWPDAAVLRRYTGQRCARRHVRRRRECGHDHGGVRRGDIGLLSNGSIVVGRPFVEQHGHGHRQSPAMTGPALSIPLSATMASSSMIRYQPLDRRGALLPDADSSLAPADSGGARQRGHLPLSGHQFPPPDTTAPTVDLAIPPDASAILQSVVNVAPFHRCHLQRHSGSGWSPASITDVEPEFTLSGTAAADVTVNPVPTPVFGTSSTIATHWQGISASAM